MNARRIASSAPLAILAAVIAGFLAWQLIGSSGGEPGPPKPARHALRTLGKGWTRLPSPPTVRDGMSLVWAGSELLAWGGCDAGSDDCAPVTDGFAFDPEDRTWRAIPNAPLPGSYAKGVWTGTEAIFFPQRDRGHLVGEAYQPESATWRRIATAPTAAGDSGVTVWTGSQVIVWGSGGRGNGLPTEGAAYNPSEDAWRRIPDAPIGLNLVSGMWTGSEMLVFGSLLHAGNRAITPTSVGAAYNPASDEWRKLPRSALSPQATTSAWVDHRMVSWDYGLRSQEYDPETNTWTKPLTMPLSAEECYPDSAVVRGLVFGFYCGYAALYDVKDNRWMEIHGGPLATMIYSPAYERSIKRWRFADLVPAGNVVFFLAEGITLNPRGTAQYGFPDAPHSFWAYRPDSLEIAKPENAEPEPSATRHESALRSRLSMLERRTAPGRPHRQIVIGHSALGRPIRLAGYGYGGDSTRILIFGCIHGTECAASGIQVAHGPGGCPPAHAIFVVPNLNPDGLAEGTRLNGRGVDLNRNFPAAWRPMYSRGDPEYSGPRPFSEPETRLAARLIRLHWPAGTATHWQNTRFPGTSSFVVELPPGAISAEDESRYARGIAELGQWKGTSSPPPPVVRAEARRRR